MSGTAEHMTDERWKTRTVVRVYRATGGRVFGTHHGRPVLLLTTIGHDTGAPWTMPVVFIREADRFLVEGDGQGDSCWHENLLREPSARVEIGTSRSLSPFPRTIRNGWPGRTDPRGRPTSSVALRPEP